MCRRDTTTSTARSALLSAAIHWLVPSTGSSSVSEPQLAEILAKSGLDDSKVEAFDAQFAELIEVPDSLGFDVLFPDTIPVLTRLAATYRCGLVSLRSSTTALRAQLAVFALTPFFEIVETAAAGCGSGLSESAPDPQDGP